MKTQINLDSLVYEIMAVEISAKTGLTVDLRGLN